MRKVTRLISYIVALIVFVAVIWFVVDYVQLGARYPDTVQLLEAALGKPLAQCDSVEKSTESSPGVLFASKKITLKKVASFDPNLRQPTTLFYCSESTASVYIHDYLIGDFANVSHPLKFLLTNDGEWVAYRIDSDGRVLSRTQGVTSFLELER